MPELEATEEERKALPAPAKQRGAAVEPSARRATIRRWSPTLSDAGRAIAVAGASGRMGRMLVEAMLASRRLPLTGALDIAGSPALGNDAAAFLGRACGVTIVADLAPGWPNAEVLIDFTRPEGTLAHLAACREHGVKAVIGTTGFTRGQKPQIAAPRGTSHRAGAQHERRRQRHPEAARSGGAALGRATTSKSSRPTTGTRWTPPPAPP